MSKPHGEPEFTYHPHKVDDAEHFRREYDRIFRKAPPEAPKQETSEPESPVPQDRD